MRSSTSSAAVQAVQILTVLLSIVDINGSLLSAVVTGVTFPGQTNLKNETSYDYIIIGGGTAGCVVATRLAQDETSTVLVLEAGGDPPVNALLASTFSTLPKTAVDYNHQSSYDPYAAGSQGNYSTLTAGKMLGGSASMNHFIHTRGCPPDFDAWAEIVGDDGWKFENVLPYFIKSETLDDKEILAKYPEYHGTKGPMGISRQTSSKTDNYLESFEELGHPSVLDLNSPETVKGYSQAQFMLDDSVRQTPAVSYLSLVKDNSNLYISKNTRVIKIIFEGTVAIGVQAVYNDETYTLYANKEVILSAGVFNSPQVLMLSGIGPKDHLTSLGIDCISDLPVGDGYTDQGATMLVYATKKYLLPNPLDSVSNPYKIPFPIIVGAVAVNDSQTCADYQDFNLLLPHDTTLLTAACRMTFWYRLDICTKLQLQATNRDVMFTLLANLIPKSRGTIRMESADPFGELIIKTGYLQDDQDLENMIDFVLNHIKILKTTYFLENDAELLGLDLSECADKEANSREFWGCYIRNMLVSPYHYTGTCAMGNVVDGNLTVIGFDNLKVIDASVIPVTPKAAPNAAVVMLAEKGADLVKSKYS